MTNIEIQQLSILKYNGSESTKTNDSVALEEPLEISIVQNVLNNRQEKPISITMRTPGADKELAVGFLFTEGIIEQYNQIDKVVQIEPNKIAIEIADGVSLNTEKLDRHFYTNSSCGVCGKSSIDNLISVSGKSSIPILEHVNTEIVYLLNDTVKSAQSVFKSTGGLHASALFDTNGILKGLYEDVGRHNALDKLIGKALLDGKTPLHNHLLFLSGRASFELIQKAIMGNIPIVCALGAPSSMAIELAGQFNITLIGFLKSNSFNLYTAPERVV